MAGEVGPFVLAIGRGPDGQFHRARSRRGELSCLQVAARSGHAGLAADFLDLWDGWSADEKCPRCDAAS
jgi:hypothetical protein